MTQPASVTRAIWSLWGLVALGGITALLAWVFHDELVRSWAGGHRTAREILEQGGLEGLEESAIAVPAFVPVATVLWVVFALLAWVFVVFLRGGHDWARWSIIATVVFIAVATVGGLRTSPPLIFVVLSWLSFALDAAVLFFLLRRDAGGWIRRT